MERQSKNVCIWGKKSLREILTCPNYYEPGAEKPCIQSDKMKKSAGNTNYVDGKASFSHDFAKGATFCSRKGTKNN